MAPELEEFARLLMQQVRDKAISACDMSRNPKCNSIDAKRWRKRAKSVSIDEFLAEIIPDCVDNAIFYLLHSIDEGLLAISFKSKNGKVIELTQAGDSEMAGSVASGDEEDWRKRYSKERMNDNYAEDM